jgi:hypothetical protein
MHVMLLGRERIAKHYWQLSTMSVFCDLVGLQRLDHLAVEFLVLDRLLPHIRTGCG